jgi:hypothetical protein
MMKRLRILIALTGVLALVIGSQLSASAADTTIFHGSDSAHVTNGDRIATVCDHERDGHAVTGTFYTPFRTLPITDENGSKSPCWQFTFPSNELVIGFKLCEETKGCTRIYYP